MLVLSRRLDEKIFLPTVPVLIKVISFHSSLVRLGLEAPWHVPILREELTRGEHAAAAPAAEADVAGPQQTVRDRVNNLIMGLALLRALLVDCDPAVRLALDAVEEEVEALRRCVRAAQAAEGPGVASALAGAASGVATL